MYFFSLKKKKIAKTKSDCGSAQSGGDLGQFGKGDMQKP
jgi:parvulin-like peptidyl-prolyl isomerase